jgi:hypothetical protein
VILRAQVDADFARARRMALRRRVIARLQGGPDDERLRCFEEVRVALGARGRVRGGLRTVRVDRIVGSVGRCTEFDRAFLPARPSLEERWKRVDLAFRCGDELPPISLYKVGDAHFVLDGNHRVSVARFHGAEWIDAEVTEFHVPSPGGRKCGDTGGKSPRTGGLAVHDMTQRELAKQRREEIMREVERSRLAREIRDSRERRRGSGLVSSLLWELKRDAGRLRKVLRYPRRG